MKTTNYERNSVTQTEARQTLHAKQGLNGEVQIQVTANVIDDFAFKALTVIN